MNTITSMTISIRATNLCLLIYSPTASRFVSRFGSATYIRQVTQATNHNLGWRDWKVVTTEMSGTFSNDPTREEEEEEEEEGKLENRSANGRARSCVMKMSYYMRWQKEKGVLRLLKLLRCST